MRRKFGDLVRESKGYEGFLNGETESKDYVLIPINQICCRSVNKYVDKQDGAESLKRSIKSLGLIEPIIVIRIDEYKEKIKDLSEEDLQYLTQMEELGCKYFISSGHRRFKAFISLALKRDMYPGNQIMNLYSEDTASKIQEYYDQRAEGFPDGFKAEYAFYEIPCKIEKRLIENENDFYNQSNSTQRELTNYEIIINAIDSLKTSGQMKEYETAAVNKVVDELSPRKTTEWLNNYVKEGLLEKKQVNSLDNEEQKKELLKTIPVESVGKTKNVIAQLISEYIANDSGRNISPAKIGATVTMLEQIERLQEYINYDLMSYVYAGEMNFNEAFEISRITEKLLNEKGKKDVETILINPLETARDKNQEIFKDNENNSQNDKEQEYIKLSDISKKAVKDLKAKYSKKKKEKRLSYTNSELIEFLYAIDRGDMTAREAIQLIEKLNKD